MNFNNTIGFDFSYWQGVIDFAKTTAYGAKFIILRCGYALVKDIRFDEYMDGVGDSFPISTYHYYDPRFNPTEQANKVIATLSQYRNRIKRVWLDFEFSWAGTYQAPEHWLVYRNALEMAGYKTGIYTRATWWDSRVGVFAGEFAKRPCWAAQYSNALTLIPKGWSKAMIWQKGTPAIGSLVGTNSAEVDLDIWNDDFDFAAEWGIVQPPPPTNGEPMPTWKVITASLKIRSGPSINFSQIGGLYQGDKIEGVFDTPSGWIHISRIIRLSSGEVVLFDGWCSGSSLYVELVETTPPPAEQDKIIVFVKESGVTKTYTITGYIVES